MKKAIIILSVFLCWSALGEKISIQVPGMVCQMCVQGMRKVFKNDVSNPGRDVSVDLDKKLVHVNLSNTLSDSEIKKRIKNAGYNVKTITRL